MLLTIHGKFRHNLANLLEYEADQIMDDALVFGARDSDEARESATLLRDVSRRLRLGPTILCREEADLVRDTVEMELLSAEEDDYYSALEGVFAALSPN